MYILTFQQVDHKDNTKRSVEMLFGTTSGMLSPHDRIEGTNWSFALCVFNYL